MKTSSGLLNNCLFFVAGALQRQVARMADERFRRVGLSPSHAFILMVVVEEPGASPTRLAQVLHLAPSTITRFVDSLERKGLVLREPRGKAVGVLPTKAGESSIGDIHAAWAGLHNDYSQLLGRRAGDDLARHIAEAVAKFKPPVPEGAPKKKRKPQTA